MAEKYEKQVKMLLFLNSFLCNKIILRIHQHLQIFIKTVRNHCDFIRIMQKPDTLSLRPFLKSRFFSGIYSVISSIHDF